MYCDQCGARLEASAAQCPRCATPVARTRQAERPTSPYPRDPAPPREPAVPDHASPDHHSPNYDPLTPRAPARPSVAAARRLLSAAVTRNVRGNAAGLLAAWFNFPLVVLMTAIGALFGGIGGAVSGTIAGPGVLSRIDGILFWLLPLPISAEDLLPTAAIQIGGIVGGLWGAANGALTMAWTFLVGPWTLLYGGDPTWPLALAAGQLITAFFAAALYTLYSVWTEGWRLRAAGVRRPSRREAHLLVPIMAEAARRLGASTVPLLLIDDSREPNATAGARHIVVNQGLLEFLRYDTDAVAGVLAHEVAHWHHGDAVAMAWGRGIALPLFLVNEIAFRAQRVARWRPLAFLLRVLLWSVTVTMKYFVVPLHAAHWRRCEYRADAAAMAAGYGDGLHHALSQLRGAFDGARSGWDASICATHPPTELRLERLERPGGHYPLPRGPGEPGAIPQVTVARGGPDKD